MTAPAVGRKRRWNTAQRGRRCLFLSLSQCDFQIADAVIFDGLKPRISNWQRITAHPVPRPEMMAGVSALPDADEKFSGLGSDAAAHPQDVAHIGVAALIERAGQSDPRLDRNQHALPWNLADPGHAARLCKLYSWCSPPKTGLATT